MDKVPIIIGNAPSALYAISPESPASEYIWYPFQFINNQCVHLSIADTAMAANQCSPKQNDKGWHYWMHVASKSTRIGRVVILAIKFTLHTHAHTHTCTHARMHARTHARIHTHTLNYFYFKLSCVYTGKYTKGPHKVDTVYMLGYNMAL